jgi:hypothetical protein
VPALTGAAALFLIIFLSVPAPNHKAAPTKGAPAQTTTQPSQPGTGAGQPDTTSNLDSQLNGVGSAINQENADQANANTALNDSQYEIAVPTN